MSNPTLDYGRRYKDAWSYIYGGDRYYPERYGGTDCSGFVHANFWQNYGGISVGTWTYGIFVSAALETVYHGDGNWNNVPWDTLQPEDIILMSSDSTTFATGTGSHVGIYTGTRGVCLDVGSTPCVKERDMTWYRAISICVRRLKRKTQPKKEVLMKCFIQPDGESYLEYYDGVNIHPLGHPDEMEAIQMIAEATLGYRLPVFALGSKRDPWATRFHNAISRVA